MGARPAGFLAGRGFRWTLGTLVLAGVAVLALAGLYAWLGLFDVSATAKHPRPIEWFLHFVMRRSVMFHARELPVPNLEDPGLILRGALYYAGTCAACHGAPGQLASPVAQQMTPGPPGLYSARQDFDPSQLFWIIKNGVKFTAMPAWPAADRDDEIWAMVAFVEHLPTLTSPAYAALVGNAQSSWLPTMSPVDAGFDPGRCVACHGSDGRGRAGAIASIAGHPESQLEAALFAYRDGSRPSGFMQPFAAQLSDRQIRAAARYYAGLPEGAP
jgi:cytochrome c553